MKGDYLELNCSQIKNLELNQFPYNFHQFFDNSYPSPLGTTKFLTSGIRVIDLKMDECNRRELWKELWQMVNKVSEDVKALYESHNVVLEKVKALVESNMAMKEELSRMQEDFKNVTEEEIQFLKVQATSYSFMNQLNLPMILKIHVIIIVVH